MSAIVVSANVVSKEPEQITRAFEALARAAAGLALEGIYVSVSASTVEDNDDE